MNRKLTANVTNATAQLKRLPFIVDGIFDKILQNSLCTFDFEMRMGYFSTRK